MKNDKSYKLSKEQTEFLNRVYCIITHHPPEKLFRVRGIGPITSIEILKIVSGILYKEYYNGDDKSFLNRLPTEPDIRPELEKYYNTGHRIIRRPYHRSSRY